MIANSIRRSRLNSSRSLHHSLLIRPTLLVPSTTLTNSNHSRSDKNHMNFFNYLLGSAKNQSTMSNTEDIKQNIVAETSTHDVVVYSKSYCPYCSSTKQLFSSKFPNVKAKVIELDQISSGPTIQSVLAEITGQRTVPNVWVKGKFVGGNDDTQGLFRSGKLSEMLH